MWQEPGWQHGIGRLQAEVPVERCLQGTAVGTAETDGAEINYRIGALDAEADNIDQPAILVFDQTDSRSRPATHHGEGRPGIENGRYGLSIMQCQVDDEMTGGGNLDGDVHFLVRVRLCSGA